jgi:hypothetical protein
MPTHRVTRWLGRSMTVPLAIAATVAIAAIAVANVPRKVVSQDPFTNTSSYHATEVEPDTFAAGSTVVSLFQAGRFTDGGASNIGWATSTNGGGAWTSGFLPDTTIYANPPGLLKRVTDPSVTYDAAHGEWLLGILGSRANNGFTGSLIFVSRSTDGLTWSNPVTVQRTNTGSFDSTWVNCDNWPTSPNYGHCYFEWDDHGNGNQLHIATSTDGGVTWTEASVPPAIVIGGKPVSMPNGTVVVPIDDGFASQAESFISRDGGVTFKGPNSISPFSTHVPGGGLRTLDIVSADVDASGKVYVVWYDCRFRAGCSSNDVVMSTSTDGKNWTPAVQVPIDDVSSTVDHFLPGITVEEGTSGSTAHLGLVYWFYPAANCNANCKLNYGYIQSTDGGAMWGTPTPIAGPFSLASLPDTTSGFMVGDYSSVNFSGGAATTVFAFAKKGTICQINVLGSCDVAMNAPQTPLPLAGPFRAGATQPVAGWASNVPTEVRQSAN